MQTRYQARKEKDEKKAKKIAKLERTSTALNMVGQISENSQYILEEIQAENVDYTLIKKSFDATMLYDVGLNLSKMYRVGIRNSDEPSGQENDNLLLFHGTNRVNAIGILENGFKPSTRGIHGPGVYLTECSSCAGLFAYKKNRRKRKNKCWKDKLLFILVNEILESKKLELIVNKKTITTKTASPRKDDFEKYIKKWTANKYSNETYEQDSNGRKIKTSTISRAEIENYYVCDEKLIIPRYLIQCFPNKNKDV